VATKLSTVVMSGFGAPARTAMPTSEVGAGRPEDPLLHQGVDHVGHQDRDIRCLTRANAFGQQRRRQ
jgi:hypothetical protein